MSLSISRAWDETTTVFKRDGKPLWTIALALIGLPFTLTNLVSPASATAAAASGGSTLLSLVTAALVLVATVAISMIVLRQNSTVGRAIGDSMRKLVPLVLTILMVAIPLFLLLAVLAGVLVGTEVSPQALEAELAAGRIPPAVGRFILWALVIGLLVNVKMLMVTPVAAIESDSPVRILKRTWSLTKGHFLKLLGFLLLYSLVSLVLFMAVQFVIGTAVIAMFGVPEALSLGALIIALAVGALYSIVTTVYAVMVARIYMQLAGADAAVPVIPRD